MMRPSIFITLSFFFLISCKNEKERAIVGKWNAAKLVECDDEVPLNNTSVNLEFASNGKYIFNSTLNVHEEGDFYIQKNHLYTQDKLRDKAAQKIVKIQQLSKDTLVLEMNYKGKEQWLTLVRETSNNKPSTPPSQPASTPPTPTTNPNAVAVSQPSPTNINTVAASTPVAPTTSEPKKEDKLEEEKKGITKDKAMIAAEAYRKREAERLKEEEERKKEREEYLKREAQRKKEALEREKQHDKEVREAYLKREAARKKEEEERKRKAKKS